MTLMDAAVLGDEHGVIKLDGPNPFVVQMQSFFASRPRGHGKYDVASAVGFEPTIPQVLCVYLDGFSGGKIFCQRYGAAWLSASKCDGCSKNRFQ